MSSETKWKLLALSSDLNETRAGGSDDSVFEIIPRTLIHGQDKFKLKLTRSKFEKCVAVSSGGAANSQIGIAVDNELLIFDSKAENIEETLPFSSSIDIIVWNRCLLVVGLSSSEVHFLNPSTFEVIDTRVVEESAEAIVNRSSEGRFYVNGHVKVEDGSCEINMTSIEGKVYRFQTPIAPDNTLDYTRLERTVCATSLSQAKPWAAVGIKQTVTCSHFVSPCFIFVAEISGNISLLKLKEDDEVEADCEPNNNLLKDCLLASNNIIKELSLNSNEVHVRKMIRFDGLLFVLLSSGSLEILFDDMLCSTSPLKLPVPNTKVHDFAVVVSDQDVKLWAIFGDYQNADKTFIGVFSGATFNPKLCVQVPLLPSLCGTELSESMLDSFSIRFNERSVAAEEPSSFICSSGLGVMIFQVLESSVESTLLRFLSLGKFEQANAFAEKYSFNMDIVKKSRVQAYYNELSTIKGEKKLERTFQHMLQTLDSISDMNFVCTFCICDKNTTIPRVEWVKMIFSLGCKKATSVSSTENGRKLLVLGKKFYTFEQVFPDGQIEDWRAFCDQSNSMFQICRQFLKNEQFSYCNCVWNRHSSEFVGALELGDLAEFFWVVFNKQLKGDCEKLFKSILGDALNKCVQENLCQERGLSGILDLIKKQICFLEQRLSWPCDAIDFVKALVKIFKMEILKLQECLLSPRYEPKTEDKIKFCQNLIQHLEFYLQSLQEISDLIRAHSMRIGFDKIIQDNLNEVVHAMLDELFTREEILLFVTKFLRPFANRKDLCLDSLFENYVETVVSYVPVYASASCIPFEERLVTLVELISDVEKKLNSVHLMASNWPVPWTAGIESVVTRTLDVPIGPGVKSRSKCLSIQGIIASIQKQVPFQCLLYKYRLFASKLETPAGIKMAVLRILKSKKKGAYEDCLELVRFTGKLDADDVLVLKIQLELEREDLPGEVEDVFPDDLSSSAAHKLVTLFLQLSSNAGECDIFNPQETDRWNKAAEYLSKKLDSRDEIEFLNLRKIAPDVKKLSVLFHPSYPFHLIGPEYYKLNNRSVEDILERCKRLAVISQFPEHEIIAAIVFSHLSYTPPRLAADLSTKLWALLEKLVQIPSLLRAPILEPYAIQAIPSLIFQMPSLSAENHLVLESLLKLLSNSFDKCFTDFSKYLSICGIFMTLREHEVPLEKEFLQLIEGPMWPQSLRGKTAAELEKQLRDLCTALVMYGEHDLMVRIINALLLLYDGLKMGSMEEAVASYFEAFICKVSEAKDDLINQSLNYRETESNPHVLKLVKSLCQVGMPVNAYSLRNRNKPKLISILLASKEFSLAADVALVFEYYGGDEWSKILQGFMNATDIMSLKGLLNDIKNITDLWAIPEFSSAWIMVSKVFPEFKNLCPIAIFM